MFCAYTIGCEVIDPDVKHSAVCYDTLIRQHLLNFTITIDMKHYCIFSCLKHKVSEENMLTEERFMEK